MSTAPSIKDKTSSVLDAFNELTPDEKITLSDMTQENIVNKRNITNDNDPISKFLKALNTQRRTSFSGKDIDETKKETKSFEKFKSIKDDVKKIKDLENAENYFQLLGKK